jgi:hypothetical protein
VPISSEYLIRLDPRGELDHEVLGSAGNHGAAAE